MAMPCKLAAIDAITTPPTNTGRRPSRTISKEAGSVVSIDATNCNDKPKVASQATGANKLPTRAVLIILTFIVVIDSACAIANLTTLPLLEVCCIDLFLKIENCDPHAPVRAAIN